MSRKSKTLRKTSRKTSRKRKRCKNGSRRSSTKKTCRDKHKKCKRGSRYSKSSKKCKKTSSKKRKSTPKKSKRKRCKKGSRRSSTKKTCRDKHKKCKCGSRYSKTSKKCEKKNSKSKIKATMDTYKETKVKTKTTIEESQIIENPDSSLVQSLLDLIGWNEPMGSPEERSIVSLSEEDEYHEIDQDLHGEHVVEDVEEECEDKLYPIHCKNKPSMCVPMWVNEEGDEREYPIDNFCNYTNDDILRRIESSDNLRDLYKKQRRVKGRFVGHRKSKSYKNKKATADKTSNKKKKKPCPPGQKRNSRTGRCRKTKSSKK
jgi:hypothetical protein